MLGPDPGGHALVDLLEQLGPGEQFLFERRRARAEDLVAVDVVGERFERFHAGGPVPQGVQEIMVGRAGGEVNAGKSGPGRLDLDRRPGPGRQARRRAEAMRAWSRFGGATKVGVFTGVSATIAAGERRRPSIVPNRQPASQAITAPAATSCAASPRKVQAWRRLQAVKVISQQALPRSRSRPGSDRGSTARSAFVPTQTLSWLWKASASRAASGAPSWYEPRPLTPQNISF